MIVQYKGRRVELDGIKGSIDEPTVDNAFYLDGDEEALTNEELDEIQDQYMDELSQLLSERYTDDAFDRMTDR